MTRLSRKKMNRMNIRSRREKEREARRMEILVAAEKVFSRKGFARASMDEVAAAAQFTKRTVYMYFVNKDDLLFAVALEGSKKLFARQQAVLAGEGSGLARIRRAALAYYEFSRDLPDLFRLIEDARHVKPRGKDSACRREFVGYRALMFEEYSKAFQEGTADRSIRRDLDPHKLVYAVVLLLNGFCQALSDAAQSGAFEPDRDAFARYTLDLVTDALRPKPEH